MVVWQHAMFDPASVLDTLICDSARRPKGCAGCHRRADLHHRAISRVAASLQCSTMFDRAECQAPAWASRTANSHARACPRGFLFERTVMSFPVLVFVMWLGVGAERH